MPDLDAAVELYRDVLGVYVIMEPTEIAQDSSDIGVMCDDVFWSRLGQVSHCAYGNSIGIELLEFEGAEAPRDNLPFRQVGLFHFAIQDPDVEGLLAKIIAAGGRQRMPVRHYFSGQMPYRMVYVEDPFGIVFELYSHGYELTYSAGAYS